VPLTRQTCCRDAELHLLIQSSHPFRPSRQADTGLRVPLLDPKSPVSTANPFSYPSGISPVCVDMGAVARRRKSLDQHQSNGQPACRGDSGRDPSSAAMLCIQPQVWSLVAESDHLPCEKGRHSIHKSPGRRHTGRQIRSCQKASPGIAVHL